MPVFGSGVPEADTVELDQRAVGDAEGRQTIGVELSAVGVDRRLGVADLDDACGARTGTRYHSCNYRKHGDRDRDSHWQPLVYQLPDLHPAAVDKDGASPDTVTEARPATTVTVGSSAVCQRPICRQR